VNSSNRVEIKSIISFWVFFFIISLLHSSRVGVFATIRQKEKINKKEERREKGRERQERQIDGKRK